MRQRATTGGSTMPCTRATRPLARTVPSLRTSAPRSGASCGSRPAAIFGGAGLERGVDVASHRVLLQQLAAVPEYGH
eukprot:5712123-Pyramimonas_sp.AAC.1